MTYRYCTEKRDKYHSKSTFGLSRKILTATVSILLLTGLSACTEEEETDTETSVFVGGPKLLVDRTLTTININERGTVKVRSDDGEGNLITFSAIQSGNCVVAQAAAEEISITASGGACTDTITITADDRNASLTVNVIDPAVMDIGEGLQIKYTNVHQNRWDDNGSGGDIDVTFWHPVAGSDGWYPLGSYIRADYSNVNTLKDAAVVIVKDQGTGNALAPPTDFTLIWTDAGSGADRDGAIWNPICPVDFVGLGSIGTSGGKPSTEDMRCVAERFTARASAGSMVYNDNGTGADSDLSIYQIATPDLPTKSGLGNKAPMTTETFIACSGATTSCDNSSINLLLVPLSDFEQGEYMDQAVLTGYRSLELGDTLTASVRIPFTLIPAAREDTANTNRNVTETPFYTLSRIERFASLAALDNRQVEKDVELTYTTRDTFSQTDTSSFTKSVGLSITVGGGASFLGSGGNWEATLDTNLSWSSSTSSSFGGSITNSAKYLAPPGKYVQLVQVETVFQAYDADGNRIGESIGAGKNVLKYLQFPL